MGWRIAQPGDIHYDDYFSVVPLRKAIDIVNGLQFDLVVVTGDFETPGWPRRALAVQAAKAIEPCGPVAGPDPRSFRNSSGSRQPQCKYRRSSHCVLQFPQHSGFLRNRSVPLEREVKRLLLCGVDDILQGKPKLDLALKEIPPDEPVVLMAHEPDWADYVAKHPVDRSGHSYGWQIRMPSIGVPYLPPMAREYP